MNDDTNRLLYQIHVFIQHILYWSCAQWNDGLEVKENQYRSLFRMVDL